MSKMNMIFTDFMKDVEANIESRITGLPKHELQEISAYIANRAAVMANDISWECRQEFLKDLSRSSKRRTPDKEMKEEHE